MASGTFVFSNLAISIDGKIATRRRGHFPLGSPEDRRHMQRLRARCDAVLMGAGTLRACRRFCGLNSAPVSRQPANAIISSALEGVSPDWPFFRNPRLRRILFVSGKLSAARIRRFERSCEIIPLHGAWAGKPSSLAFQAIRTLETLGFRNLLVEGGGQLMWDFVSGNLIDEYHVTLTPKLVGGESAPTLVEGAGFFPTEILKLKLVSCRRVGDELYLVYKKR